MAMIPKVPKRWVIRGELPNVDGGASDADLELLDEDLLQITDAAGAYVIDVGWYPAGQRTGRFVCRIVPADDWERPIEQTELATKDAARQWLNESIERVKQRLGQQGEFSNRVGMWIYPMTSRGRVLKSAKAKKRPAPIIPEVGSPIGAGAPGNPDSPPQVSSSFTAPLRVRPEMHAT